jgi:hypothetical protein
MTVFVFGYYRPNTGSLVSVSDLFLFPPFCTRPFNSFSGVRAHREHAQ